jgi:ribosome-associated translation inhibitor RaiA
MKIIISSHNVTGISGQGFDQYLQHEIQKKISKYINKYAVRAHILFDKVRGGYNCTLIVRQNRIKHYNLQVNVIAFCPYDSFNFALNKLVGQMIKYKGIVNNKKFA